MPFEAARPPTRYSTLQVEATRRWLDTRELVRVLRSPELYGLGVSSEPPLCPPSGTLFLFDRTLCKAFRKDGHQWRRKTSGAVAETSDRLKLDGRDCLTVAYTRERDDPSRPAAELLHRCARGSARARACPRCGRGSAL